MPMWRPDSWMVYLAKLQTPVSQQRILGWALIGAAGVCLLTSIGLAIADRVAAGSLTASLFVVCVLFHYLPQMESFKAYGIEAKWREVRRAFQLNVDGQQSVEQLTHQIETAESKEALLATANAAVTQLSTANNVLSEALTSIDLITKPPELSRPPLSTKRSD
jgi:hypothetical protein